MKTALLFPGQGAQAPAMAAPFVDAWSAARETMAAADGAVSLSLAELCLDGDAAALRDPRVTQPAVAATSLAALAGLRAAVATAPSPDAVAGHSLGHWTALAAAGILDPADCVSLVAERGAAMARAAGLADETPVGHGATDVGDTREDHGTPEGDGTGAGEMVAVLGAERELVATACASHDGAALAAANAPGRTTISGTGAGVAAAEAAIERAAGGRVQFVDLDVGAAFHSPLVADASGTVAELLESAALAPASTPVVSDVTGEAYTEPAVARRDLRRQVTAPVEWQAVVETLLDRGVERFVELPPAGTLTGFVEAIAPEATAVAIETPADAVAALGE